LRGVVTPSSRVDWRGAPLIALSCVLFALMAVLARFVSPRMSVGQLVLIRMATGAAVMGGYYLALRRRPDIPRPIPWALRGLFGGGAVFFYFIAIERLQVGPATVLNYSSPVYAAILAALFLGEAVTLPIATGIAIATFGSGMVALASGTGTHWLDPGALCGMVSAFLGGAAMATIRGLRRDTSAASIFFSFCLFGVLWSLPFALPTWRALDAATWALAIAVGLLALGAQLLLTHAFAYVGAAQGSVATQLTPAFSWILGVLWLHESVAPLALVGALICVGGVALGSLANARAVPASQATLE
jgi:drug/metabolite transporter (DMT)-like permease